MSDKQVRAFMVLARLSGKVTTDQIVDAFIEHGILDNSPDAVRDWLRHQALQYVIKQRKASLEGGDFGQQMLHFTETLDDGAKHNYFRRAEETTPQEGAQHINKAHRVAKARKQDLVDAAVYFAGLHGASKLIPLTDFPSRPLFERAAKAQAKEAVTAYAPPASA